MCGVDICQMGYQFCNRLERRCVWCSDVQSDCFTPYQQQNCTMYCMEKWKGTQEAVNFNQKIWTVPAYVFLSTTIILAFTIFIVVLFYNKKKARSCLNNIGSSGPGSALEYCCRFSRSGADQSYMQCDNMVATSEQVTGQHQSENLMPTSSDFQASAELPRSMPRKISSESKVRRELSSSFFTGSAQQQYFNM